MVFAVKAVTKLATIYSAYAYSVVPFAETSAGVIEMSMEKIQTRYDSYGLGTFTMPAGTGVAACACA